MDENFTKALYELNIDNLTIVSFTTPKREFLKTYSKKYINEEINNDNYFTKRYEALKILYEKRRLNLQKCKR